MPIPAIIGGAVALVALVCRAVHVLLMQRRHHLRGGFGTHDGIRVVALAAHGESASCCKGEAPLRISIIHQAVCLVCRRQHGRARMKTPK